MALIAAAAFVAGSGAAGDWLRIRNPFAEETVDRTGTSVLQSLTNISEFHPAYAHYETVVDLQNDVDNLPSWFSGERVIYIAKGDVDAVVDFDELEEDSVDLSADGASVSVRLPEPRIDEPALDLENSYVVNHDKGFITKFEGSDLEQKAQLAAVKQMAEAADREGMLMARAKENTTTMLRSLLGSLGYTSVSVTFEGSPG